MKKNILVLFVLASLMSINVNAEEGHDEGHGQVPDHVITMQNAALEKNTKNKGFGPQSPRDIDSQKGSNPDIFSTAPDSTKMNLCNIHFHKNAEHKGGEFTKYAGNGDGHGYQSGYLYSGSLSEAEAKLVEEDVCSSEHGGLQSGDTIEVHYVHSSAQVKPGPTLGACLNDSIKNPQLRVEAQVFVLVNDPKALNFGELAKLELKNGFYQAINIPSDTGAPVRYSGSTTGPNYNEQGSPFQVSWSVRPKVAKVDIKSVGKWCKENVFKENHAHGVRNLVTQPNLLSKIE